MARPRDHALEMGPREAPSPEPGIGRRCSGLCGSVVEKFVKHPAHGMEVVATVLDTTLRGVRRGARGALRIRLGMDQTEVPQLPPAVGEAKDVRRLHVAVQQTVAMEVVQAVEYLLTDCDDLAHRERAVTLRVGVQRVGLITVEEAGTRLC